MYMNGNYYYSFLNISFFSAIGRLLPIDASRIIVISFLIIINRFREGSLARRSRTKIIIILLFGSPGRPRRAPMKRPARAGDGRAEHAFASASTNAMHEFVHDPHGLRCAVQARCNSCLVSRGDAPVAPAGQMHDDDTAKEGSSEGTHRPSGRRRSSRLSGHNFFVMKNTPQFKEMRYKPGDKHNQWHVYGFFFHTNLGSTTECAADEVSFEDAWGKRDHGGPSWFRCDDTNIWPPDGG